MRTTDASLAFPVILLAIVIVGVFGASTRNVIIILAVAGWPSYARVLRSRGAAPKSQDFVTQARAMGGGVRWVDPAPHPAEHRADAARAGQPAGRPGDHRRGLAELHRPRRAAARRRRGAACCPTAARTSPTRWWLPTMPGIALSLVVLVGEHDGRLAAGAQRPDDEGGSAVLEVEGLHTVYYAGHDEVPAVRGIDLHVQGRARRRRSSASRAAARAPPR